LVIHLAFAAVLGAAASARAADAGPVAAAPPSVPEVPESNVAQPNKQAPPSAPAGSDANFPTGLVERLPTSAYPEPVIRGLYGSSLWLDLQGLQWPYYPRIGVGISGYAWVDTDYKRTRIGDPLQSDHTTKLFMQGRYDLRVTPTYSNGNWFVQAQAEIIANLDQLNAQPIVADTDDMWVRAGSWKTWDLTVGRFEAFSVYHLGMGLDLNTDERIGAYDGTHGPLLVPQAYMASYLLYRPVGPGNVALHLYPGGMFPGSSFLSALLRPARIELLAQWGNDNILNQNYIGGRPALIYDLGYFKFRVAGEYQWRFAQDPAPSQHNESKNRGVAGSVQIVLAPWIEFGPNFGRAVTDVWTPTSPNFPDEDRGLSGDIVSYGGFVNARLLPDMLVGGGYNYASFTNLHTNLSTGENDKSSNAQYFVALQYLVHHQLFVKVVGGYAKTHFDFRISPGMIPYDDDMFSVRVRLMYLY
jgi:hypothetical protein